MTSVNLFQKRAEVPLKTLMLLTTLNYRHQLATVTVSKRRRETQTPSPSLTAKSSIILFAANKVFRNSTRSQHIYFESLGLAFNTRCTSSSDSPIYVLRTSHRVVARTLFCSPRAAFAPNYTYIAISRRKAILS